MGKTFVGIYDGTSTHSLQHPTISSIPYSVGPFFGWQILCDLEESMLPKFDDSFCELAPGKRTIQVVPS
jgi:hypothetical protein